MRTSVRVDGPAALTGANATAAVGGGSAPAAEDAAHGSDPAADDEAGDCGADDHFALVATEVTAPVGGDGHLRPQAVHRPHELVAIGLDRLPDLLRRACGRTGHQVSCSLVLRASSIAISGIGGAPPLNSRDAMNPATPPIISRIAAITKNPQKIWFWPTGSTNQASQASPSNMRTTAKITKTAAAPPTAAPFASFDIFSDTSALASSISSRTSSEARSEISLTASAMPWAELWSSEVIGSVLIRESAA